MLIIPQEPIKGLDGLPENLVFNSLRIENFRKYYVAHRLIEEAKSVNLSFVHPLTASAWMMNLNR